MALIAHPAEGSVREEQDRNYEGSSTCVLSPSDLTSSDIVFTMVKFNAFRTF